MQFKFQLGDHVFVKINNGAIYKTKIEDSRITTLHSPEGFEMQIVEYFVKNNSYDAPCHKWVNQDKFISVYDIDALLKLDESLSV